MKAPFAEVNRRPIVGRLRIYGVALLSGLFWAAVVAARLMFEN